MDRASQGKELAGFFAFMRCLETKPEQTTRLKSLDTDSTENGSEESVSPGDLVAIRDFFRLLDKWERKDGRARTEN